MKLSIFLFFFFSSIASNAQVQVADTMLLESDFQLQSTKLSPTFVKVSGIVIPSAMIAYGIVSLESHALMQLDSSTEKELHEDNATFYHTVDDIMQFSPAMVAFGLKLGGKESKHKLSDMFILYALSNGLETGIVYSIKKINYRTRPNGVGSASFPSGHTATAFVAAEFFHQEYKDKSPWISVSGYAMASLIGASRVYNDKHWVSDVVTGAGIGILSTKLVYWSYPAIQKIFHKKDKEMTTLAFPSYTDGGLSLNVAHTF